jgi:hypothetical protein
MQIPVADAVLSLLGRNPAGLIGALGLTSCASKRCGAKPCATKSITAEPARPTATAVKSVASSRGALPIRAPWTAQSRKVLQ